MAKRALLVLALVCAVATPVALAGDNYGDQKASVDVILAARSFGDVIDQLDYLGAIAKQDKSVAAAVAAAKHQITVQRARTKKIRKASSRRRRSFTRACSRRRSCAASCCRAGAVS